MPRRKGKDKDPQKHSTGTQYEQQDEGKQRQSARQEPALQQDYRQQRRTGHRSTRPARTR